MFFSGADPADIEKDRPRKRGYRRVGRNIRVELIEVDAARPDDGCGPARATFNSLGEASWLR